MNNKTVRILSQGSPTKLLLRAKNSKSSRKLMESKQ